MDTITRSGWIGLLEHCHALEQSAPGPKWSRRSRELLSALGESKSFTAMVRWRESVLFLAASGVEEVVEIGAGHVLTGLVKRIAPDLATRSVGLPAEAEALIRHL